MVIHSKLRSWLTIIGIVIGVASVIAIVSVGDGMEQSVNEQLGDLGSDIVTLSPGYSKSKQFSHGRASWSGGSNSEAALTRTDVQVLKGIPDVKFIDTHVSGQAEVYYIGEEGTLSITGVDQKVWSDMTTDETSVGRLLDSADQNVIVIGHNLAHEYFDKEIGINQILTIEGRAFRVVGVLEEGTRNSIIMPINSAYQVLDDKTIDEYDSIIMKVDESDLQSTVEYIEKRLMLTRHVTDDDKDFTLYSNQQLNESKNEMLSTMTAFLTLIAAISLIVGAVGIANTMFTSVIEKTKEIGIMKAIGAKNRDILFIFLFNSAAIGLTGGLLGVMFGYLLSGAFNMMGMTTVVKMVTVLAALGVSVFVGMIAGLIPAVQASELNPVDALRYE